MMNPKTWFDAIQHCQHSGMNYVLVTLIAAAGSTPRDGGTKMVVMADSCFDTIGGGHLEHLVTKQARDYLIQGKHIQHLEHYPLGSKLGQCCGGATNVLFEVMVEHSQQLMVFGAGHVAKALMPIIGQLPLQISWVDERPELFEDAPELATNVSSCVSEFPVDEIASLSAGGWVLVMTHNHQLDYELVCKALSRDDIAFVGMIGSDTKARRFRTRLSHQGFCEAQIKRLVSPVGELAIQGKKPIEVAVSMAGQLINLLNTKQMTTPAQDKAAWQQTKSIKAMFEKQSVAQSVKDTQ